MNHKQAVAVVLSVALACLVAPTLAQEVQTPNLSGPPAPPVAPEAGQAVLHSRLMGNLGELYRNGATAMRGAVDQMQPDIKRVGDDLSDVYQATRDSVGRRIEPITQTVRPFINSAQEKISPYIDQARQEVPKLIDQARPTLAKYGEQVSNGFAGVWDRLKNVAQDASATISRQVQPAAEQKQPEQQQQV